MFSKGSQKVSKVRYNGGNEGDIMNDCGVLMRTSYKLGFLVCLTRTEAVEW